MAFPLLPSLKTDSKVAIPKNGEWTISAQNTLPILVLFLIYGRALS